MNQEKMSGLRKFHFQPSELKVNNKTIRLSVPVKLGLAWGVFTITTILTIVLSTSSSDKKKSETTDLLYSTTVSEKNEDFFSEDAKKIDMNLYPAVNELITTYYLSHLSADTDSLKGMVVDETALYPKATYEALGEYIEAYQDINCYSLPLEEYDSAIVLATYQTKFKGVDTLAPGTGLFYIINLNSTPIIDNTFSQNSELDGKVNEFANNPTIIDITSGILEDYNKALESDENLKAVIEAMSHPNTNDTKDADTSLDTTDASETSAKNLESDSASSEEA